MRNGIIWLNVSKATVFWTLIILLFITMSFAKMPQVLLQGRLWAEEGSVFMQDMQSKSLMQAVIYNYRGSIQLITALACWFATRTSIMTMPYVTTYVAFGVSFILFMQMAAFARQVGCPMFLTLIFLVGWMFLPESYEVWLTSTNIQWLCSLSLLLILIQREDAIKSQFWIVSAWVLLCGVTGVPSCMLAPGFLIRAVVKRSVTFGVSGGLLALSTAIQILAILTTDFEGRPFSFNAMDILASINFGTFIQPILSVRMTNLITSIPVINGLFMMISSAAMIAAPFICKGDSTSNTIWKMWYIVGSWFLVTVLNVIGSLSGASVLSSAPLIGGRYFFFGSSCLVMALVILSSTDRRSVRRGSIALLVLIAANGIGQRVFSGWPGFFLTGPSWAEQVRQCSDIHTCSVKIWPATNPPSEILLAPKNKT